MFISLLGGLDFFCWGRFCCIFGQAVFGCRRFPLIVGF